MARSFNSTLRHLKMEYPDGLILSLRNGNFIVAYLDEDIQMPTIRVLDPGGWGGTKRTWNELRTMDEIPLDLVIEIMNVASKKLK